MKKQNFKTLFAKSGLVLLTSYLSIFNALFANDDGALPNPILTPAAVESLLNKLSLRKYEEKFTHILGARPNIPNEKGLVQAGNAPYRPLAYTSPKPSYSNYTPANAPSKPQKTQYYSQESQNYYNPYIADASSQNTEAPESSSTAQPQYIVVLPPDANVDLNQAKAQYVIVLPPNQKQQGLPQVQYVRGQWQNENGSSANYGYQEAAPQVQMGRGGYYPVQENDAQASMDEGYYGMDDEMEYSDNGNPNMCWCDPCNCACTPLSTFAVDLYDRSNFGKSIGNVHSYRTIGLYADASVGRFEPFIDLRGHWFNNKNRGALNAGIGVRYLSENAVYGGNVFYDYRRGDIGYQQVGFGLEYSTRRFDLIANFYWPVGKMTHTGSHRLFRYPAGYEAFCNKKTRALQGEEVFVGTSLNRWLNCPLPIDLYGSIGGYNYNHRVRHQKSIYGVEYGLELSYLDLLAIGVDASYDRVFKNVAMGYVTINLPFDQTGFVFCRRIERNCFYDGVTGQPVNRRDMIVVDPGKCHWTTNYPR